MPGDEAITAGRLEHGIEPRRTAAKQAVRAGNAFRVEGARIAAPTTRTHHVREPGGVAGDPDVVDLAELLERGAQLILLQRRQKRNAGEEERSPAWLGGKPAGRPVQVRALCMKRPHRDGLAVAREAADVQARCTQLGRAGASARRGSKNWPTHRPVQHDYHVARTPGRDSPG